MEILQAVVKVCQFPKEKDPKPCNPDYQEVGILQAAVKKFFNPQGRGPETPNPELLANGNFTGGRVF